MLESSFSLFLLAQEMSDFICHDSLSLLYDGLLLLEDKINGAT